MSRPGLTKQQVLDVANKLIISGNKVTIKSVRAKLGNTGSITTICKYLKIWRQEQLISGVCGKNSNVKKSAPKNIEKENEQLKFELSSLLEENQELKLRASKLESQAETFQEQNNAQKVELEKYHALYINIKNERDTYLEKATIELKEQNKALSIQLQGLYQRFDNELNALREELEEKRVTYMLEETAHKQAQTRLEKEKGRVKNLENELKRLQRQMHKLSKKLETIVKQAIENE